MAWLGALLPTTVAILGPVPGLRVRVGLGVS